jgi:hypothetical protein
VHPQLQEIRGDYDRATARLEALAARVPADAWYRRPDPHRWSPGECVEHLNLTATIFLPVIREGLPRAPRLSSPSARLRRDLMGWILWRIMPPPVRVMRVKTKPRFEPRSAGDAAALLRDFARLQQEQLQCLTDADGLALDKVTIVSPIDGRARYNLFSCFGILPRHEHRHLWQAEQSLSV